MTLARAIGRTMLSSYFVLSGIRALKDPHAFTADAQPLTDRVVPAAKKIAPEQVVDFIPEDPATLVRVNGVLQVAGGVALASGKGRRLGAGLLALSLIPTTLARHPFWSRTDPEERAYDRNQFVKNVSLLGGVLIASRDTEGKPSLTWRANETREAAVKQSRKAKRAAQKALKSDRSDMATAAIGAGVALVEEALEEAVEGGRRARKQAAKRAKEAAELAQKEAKQARKKAGKSASKVQKQAADAAEDLAKSAKKTGKKASKKAAKVQKRAQSKAEDVSKNVRKAADEAKSQLAENIELGSN